jgi:hypothetical protein
MEQAYALVLANIKRAAQRAGRNPEDITLVAVSKGVDADAVNRLFLRGQIDFGENRVQEMVHKMQLCDEKVCWHCIGQLQSNKVKYIINRVRLVQSLDRLSLAKEMDRQAQKNGINSFALVQVRYDDDDLRGGIKPDAVLSFLDGAASMPNLRIEGLMCLPPKEADDAATRDCFDSLRTLYENLAKERWPNVRMQTLSMGMSRDYEPAVEHGATMVRVGTALFGSVIKHQM